MARVLVVDDEATLVDTIRYNLRREGFDVQVASRRERGAAPGAGDRHRIWWCWI